MRSSTIKKSPYNQAVLDQALKLYGLKEVDPKLINPSLLHNGLMFDKDMLELLSQHATKAPPTLPPPKGDVPSFMENFQKRPSDSQKRPPKIKQPLPTPPTDETTPTSAK